MAFAMSWFGGEAFSAFAPDNSSFVPSSVAGPSTSDPSRSPPISNEASASLVGRIPVASIAPLSILLLSASERPESSSRSPSPISEPGFS